MTMLALIVAFMIAWVTLPAMAQDDGLSSALDAGGYVLVVTVERVIEAQGQTRLNGHIVFMARETQPSRQEMLR